MSPVRLSCLAALLLTAPALTAAQGPARPQGLWISLGGGAGLSTSEEFEGSDRLGGAMYARLGGTINPHVLLGGEFIAWGREKDGLNPARGNITLTVLVMPGDRSPLYLRAGAGLALASPLRPHMGGFTTRSTNGFGATGGLGAHVRLGGHVYLTPNLDLLFQHLVTGDDPTITAFLVMATLGLTIHS